MNCVLAVPEGSWLLNANLILQVLDEEPLSQYQN